MAFYSTNISNKYSMQSSTTVLTNKGNATLLDQFERQTAKFWEAFTVPILKSVARAFLQAASKYSPPGKNGQMLGTTSIDPKYYYCKIYDIQKMQKDPVQRLKLVPNDLNHLRVGQKFKVVRNQYRKKPELLGFRKTMVGAKKLARIQNRGLMKYSWGTLLNNFSGKSIQNAKSFGNLTADGGVVVHEAELPATFRLLAQKSPNIKKYRWGSITINPTDMQNQKWVMQGHNYKTDTNAFNGIAVQRGYNAAFKQWKSVLQARRNGAVRSLQRLLNFQINKIILKHK